MQLIIILLTIVGIMTLLSGIIVFFGSSKADRARSAWYLATTIFVTLWMFMLSAFLNASTSDTAIVGIFVSLGLVSSLMLDAAFLGYAVWNRRFGKLASLIFLALGIVISGAILIDPAAMYSEVTLSATGNTVTLSITPLYISYIIYFMILVPIISLSFLQQFLKARSHRKRLGNLAVLVIFSLASLVILIVNLIMPLIVNNWSMIWLGPLAASLVVLTIYYVILRYQALNLSLIWLKVFSYIVVVASIAIIYIIIFSVIFAALFRGSTPSIEVILLNFIMISIFIALLPAMTSLTKLIRKLILEQHPQHQNKLYDKEARKKHE